MRKQGLEKGSPHPHPTVSLCVLPRTKFSLPFRHPKVLALPVTGPSKPFEPVEGSGLTSALQKWRAVRLCLWERALRSSDKRLYVRERLLLLF